MFERILIPLDGSPRAESILGQVAAILRREDAEILLLRVVEPRPEAPRADAEGLSGEERAQAQGYIHELVHEISLRGVKAHGRVVDGPAAGTILEEARTEGATLIAMSTHGRSGLARWVLGSVAERIVRTSPVPVLLVRSFPPSPQGRLEPAPAEKLPFRRILVPTDGSAAAAAVMLPARKMAQLFDSEILLLHAEPAPALVGSAELGTLPITTPTPAEEDRATARAAEQFRHAGLRVERRTVLGDAAAAILDSSHAGEIDLIAMATHGRSGVSRWLLGSVAERVLRHAGVPLLLVRAEQEKHRMQRSAAGRIPAGELTQ